MSFLDLTKIYSSLKYINNRPLSLPFQIDKGRTKLTDKSQVDLRVSKSVCFVMWTCLISKNVACVQINFTFPKK